MTEGIVKGAMAGLAGATLDAADAVLVVVAAGVVVPLERRDF